MWTTRVLKRCYKSPLIKERKNLLNKNTLAKWIKMRDTAEKKLIKDGGATVLQPEGSTVLIPLPENIVMIDEERKEYY